MIMGVTGSRKLRVSRKGFLVLDAIHQKYKITELVSGHCPTKNNIDKDCEDWARENNIPVKLFEAKFYVNGKLDRSQGPKRNACMADYIKNCGGMLIYFQGGDGTRNMLEECMKRDIQFIDLSGNEYVLTCNNL